MRNSGVGGYSDVNSGKFRYELGQDLGMSRGNSGIMGDSGVNIGRIQV